MNLSVMHLINITARSQYEASIHKKYQSSACGPTAFATILEHYEKQPFSINMLYKKLGCTALGLPAFQLILRGRTLLGPTWAIRKIPFSVARTIIATGDPILVKFDRYSSRKFWKKPYFSYHWTVVVGIEKESSDYFLIVEDLGSPSAESKRHRISVLENIHALTFVSMRPTHRM